MNKKIVLTFLSIIFLATTFSIIVPAFNDVANEASAQTNVKLDNPLGETNPAVITQKVITAILGLTGVLALLAFIAGGLMWMTSGGSPEKVKKGRDILVWAVLGLAIIFSSYTILKYVFDALG